MYVWSLQQETLGGQTHSFPQIHMTKKLYSVWDLFPIPRKKDLIWNLGAMTTGSIKIQLHVTSCTLSGASCSQTLPQLQRNFGTLKSLILTLTCHLMISHLCFQMKLIKTFRLMNKSGLILKNSESMPVNCVSKESWNKNNAHVSQTLNKHIYECLIDYCNKKE